jgi:hypothetical protein
MFERPKKNDLDTALSMLMHETRHKLMEEVNHIKSDAIKAGGFSSNRVVVSAVAAADSLHRTAMEEAHNTLLDFIARTERPPAEIIGWARPHLENLNNSVLGLVPPNGFPQDHQRLTHQYRAVFKQRLDIMLRNVEIGHQKGAGFARAEMVESREEWISAAEALRLVAAAVKNDKYMAQTTICKRAHNGLIRTRAAHFKSGNESRANCEVLSEFWWAEGEAALTQNWVMGDFETWVKRRSPKLGVVSSETHEMAFGVSFLRADIEKMLPTEATASVEPKAAPATKGGRPSADWWEDLLINICFQYFRGDLKPKSQADVQRAMQDWITAHGYEAAESTVKLRARKVWQVIKAEDEN